jgi:cell division protein ZapA
VAQVAITINGRNFQIACEDGQEDHLAELGAYVDKRVRDLVASVGQIGDTRLVVMASLLIADELSDVYDELEALRAQAGETPGKTKARSSRARSAEQEKALASGLEAMAERIEDIAARLERA